MLPIGAVDGPARVRFAAQRLARRYRSVNNAANGACRMPLALRNRLVKIARPGTEPAAGGVIARDGRRYWERVGDNQVAMIGLVLVTHGRLAVEFRAALEHVVGAQTQIETVSIGPDDDVERRRQDILEAVGRVNDGSGVILLTDMFGGTPSNLAISVMEAEQGRGHRRRQPPDADQARQRPRREAARPGDRRRPGGRAEIHQRREPGAQREMTPASATEGGLLHRDLTIVNKRGLHARAAARFVQTAERFEAEITVTKDSTTVGGTSIMGLMMLAAGPGSVIRVSAEGTDAEAALAALAELVDGHVRRRGVGRASGLPRRRRPYSFRRFPLPRGIMTFHKEPTFTRFALVLGLLSAVGPIAIDMYMPGLPVIAEDFGTDVGAAQQTLVAFFLALAVGQPFYGPLADSYGRRPPLIWGLVLFVAAGIGCVFAPDIETLVVLRFIQGFGICSAAVIVRAVIRDLYTGPRAAQLLALTFLLLGISPLIAPLAGSFFIEFFSWQSIFWVFAFIGLLGLAMVFFLLPETLPPDQRDRKSLLRAFSGYGGLLLDRHFMALTLITGLIQTVLFSFVVGSAFFFMGVHGLPAWHYSILFATCAIVGIGLAQFSAPAMRKLGAERLVIVATTVCARRARRCSWRRWPTSRRFMLRCRWSGSPSPASPSSAHRARCSPSTLTATRPAPPRP